jgi:acyl-CoA reductase-like NAD-dependent aldehyde dehydrogenase
MIMPQNTEKVNRHIQEAESSCRVIKGTADEGEMFIAPTLVLDPASDLSIVNEETFGPILSLRPFSNEEDLMQMLHKTGYGLSASIFGKDKSRIQHIIKQIKTGNVSINDVLTHYGIASIPFGGEGLSGVGRMHGKEGLRSLCRIKSVVENRFNFIDEMWWFGKSKKMKNLLNKAIKLLYR